LFFTIGPPGVPPNWIIPENLIDRVGQRIVNVNPDPNTGAPGQIDNNFVNVPVEPNRTDQFDVRVDHSFSSRLNLFGRYSLSDTNIFRPAPRPGLSEGSFNGTFGSALWRSQAEAVGATWLVSPNLVSDFRFGFARGNFFQTPPNFGSGCPEELIGLKGAPTDNNFAPRVGFAYRAMERTVFRGAYGVFYNHTNRQGREGLLGFNFPFIVQGDANIAGSNTLKVTDAIFRGRTGEYANLKGNLVEMAHDPLGLELVLTGRIRGQVVRLEDWEEAEVGGIQALEKQFRVEKHVLDGLSGDRNTLRIGVVVLSPKP
jgi:hypothetical protein